MKSGAEAAGRKGSSCLAHLGAWVLSLQEREEEGREEAREGWKRGSNENPNRQEMGQ